MSAEVNMGFFNTPTVISQIRENKLKALAVTSLSRSPLLPDVPTLDELGVKGYEVNTWFGFVSRAGTPAEIVERLHGEIGKVLDEPTLRGRLAQQGFELAPAISPAQFAKIVSDDLAKWVPLVKASGAKVD
jgi:tripartite-type tricarboxylate transporter receptor subunit TctC